MARGPRELNETQCSGASSEHQGRDRRIVDVDISTDPRWNQFVKSHAEGLVFHHGAWLEALEREYPQDRVLLACEAPGGRFLGILPLIRTRGLPLPLSPGGQVTARRLASLPRTPLAGPLAVDRDAAAALVRAAIERVSEEPGLHLQLKPSPSTERAAFHGLVATPSRLTYVLALPNRAEDIRFGPARRHGEVMRAINKARRVGVRVRTAETEDDLRVWYELYLDTMRWNGVPARPYRFFTALWNILRPEGMMRLLLADRRHAGAWRVIAGSIVVMLNQTMFYGFNGRRLDELSARPNDAIHWHALREACEAGFRYYDFGEVEAGNAGLAQYKKKWGTTPVRLYRYYYPGGSTVVRGSDETVSVSRAAATRVWRRVPLPVTAFLGERLYRYL